jgi:tetratricopeptide (TPR) repeat protein
MSGQKRHVIAALLIAGSIAFCYMNSINGTWAMDDIVVNKTVEMEDLREMTGFRKITYFSFHLNSLVAPFSRASFRIFNILIHIINSLLVYMLTFRLVGTFFKRGESGSWKQNGAPEKPERSDLTFYAALLSGVVFALHPININAVAYIVQRMASLSTLFVLVSLHCYISATRSAGITKTVCLYILSGICIVGGIFAKENAVMTVPLILLCEYLVLSRGSRILFLRRVFIITGIGVISIGIAYYLLGLQYATASLSEHIHNLNEPMIKAGWMATDVYWTPLQHILTEFRVVSRYIFLILLPLPRFLVFDWWGFPVSEAIIEPATTLFSLLLLLSLMILSLLSLKRLPLLSFGMLWYLIAVSLESFVALGSDLYFEHRNYLPLSGLVTGITGQAVISLRNRISYRSVWTSALILCLILGSLTLTRNSVWKDSVTLWSDTLTKSPSNLRAMIAMGNSYLALSDLDNAETYYSRVVKISSRDRRIHFLNDSIYSLGMMLLLQGRLDETRELITRFDRAIVSYKPRILEGFLKALSNDLDGAMKEYREVLNVSEGIDKVVVLTLMGDASREQGLSESSIRYYNEAITLHPEFSAAYYGIAASYLKTGDIDRADDYLRKTLAIDPNHVLALSDTAEVMLMRDAEPEDALIIAEQAVSKKPPFFQPYLTMGNILILLGREEEAEDYYAKALLRGSSEHLVLLSKARSYYMIGDTEKANANISAIRSLGDIPEDIRRIIQTSP